MRRRRTRIDVINDTDSLIDKNVKEEVKRILACAPRDRKRLDLSPVHRVLQRVEFVAKLDAELQYQLAEIVFYEAFEPHTTIFREGEVGTRFYMVISGSLALQKRTGGDIVREVKSFGELALVQEEGKRAATIVSISDVECLTIEGDTYRNYLARVHKEELDRKVDVLVHQPMFSGWNRKDLERLASIMMVKKVPYNEVLISQDQETDALYFIKSGEMRVVRRMCPNQKFLREVRKDPQLSTRLSPTSSWHDRHKALPKNMIQTPRSAPLTSRSSTTLSSIDFPEQEIFVELMTLGPYSMFGEISALRGTKRSASVISNTYTEILILTRHDLLNKVDTPTRKRLEEHIEAYRNDNELMDDLIKNMKWEKYKSDLVHSILSERNKEHYLVKYTEMSGDATRLPVWRP